MYGKARRTWVMDRGIPTEATLKEMREAGTQYLVGTPRSMLGKLDQQFADKPWQQVHEAMQVKLAQHEGEFYVLAHSDQRQLKEKAMHRRRFKAYGRGLHALRRRCRHGTSQPDQPRHAAGQAGGAEAGGGTHVGRGDRAHPRRRPASHDRRTSTTS